MANEDEGNSPREDETGPRGSAHDDGSDAAADGAGAREAPAGGGRQVCVTGASGYIGSHVVRLLMEQGYRVRATVRDTSDPGKTNHLRELVADPAYPLELVSADLMAPGSYDEAIAECEYVCHVASSVRLTAKDPEREIVAPAVEGTKNVLEACRRAGTVRRLVLTSSVAAIAGPDMPEEHVFTEDDWNETATLGEPYRLAKTKAERLAWDFQRALPEDERFDLVALHPVYVIGPVYARVHLKSSPSLVRDLLKRTFPGCPRMYFNLVDVRDVALAHVRAMQRTDASGRYILQHRALWMQEMAQILAPRFPDYPIPTGRLPNFVMYGAALFDKRLSIGFLRRNLGRTMRFDNTRSKQQLDLRYRPVEESLVDTAQSFIDHGVIEPRHR